jgi:hypothetical protein
MHASSMLFTFNCCSCTILIYSCDWPERCINWTARADSIDQFASRRQFGRCVWILRIMHLHLSRQWWRCIIAFYDRQRIKKNVRIYFDFILPTILFGVLFIFRKKIIATVRDELMSDKDLFFYLLTISEWFIVFFCAKLLKKIFELNDCKKHKNPNELDHSTPKWVNKPLLLIVSRQFEMVLCRCSTTAMTSLLQSALPSFILYERGWAHVPYLNA